MTRRVRLLRSAFPGRPSFDAAVSRALLQRVARAEVGESLRLYGPDDAVAFSSIDRAQAGYRDALEAGRDAGFEPFLRLAGGRAAVFERDALAFAWCIPDSDARAGIHSRFEALAGIVARALRQLGVDARIGEVPGEYCPGAYSVNARGQRKLMGVGQRLTRGAAHVGGVIVVRASERVGAVLEPVYRALGYDFDRACVGSIEDEIGPTSREKVAAALLAEFERECELVEAECDDALLALAAKLEPEHHAATAGQRPSASGEWRA